MSTGVKIIDYGVGNLRSVEQAFVHEGIDAQFVHTAEEILSAQRLVLPGVGAFGDGMAELHRRGLAGAVREYAHSGRPLLGICLGMQMLFDASEESHGVAGLGVIGGTVRRFAVGTGLKIPQIGWNRLAVNPASKLLAGCDGTYVYFVHSYHAVAHDRTDVAAQSDYGCAFTAAIERGRIAGCQFHPEKSQDAGLRIVRNFMLL